jgi:hypothetical protein
MTTHYLNHNDDVDFHSPAEHCRQMVRDKNAIVLAGIILSTVFRNGCCTRPQILTAIAAHVFTLLHDLTHLCMTSDGLRTFSNSDGSFALCHDNVLTLWRQLGSDGLREWAEIEGVSPREFLAWFALLPDEVL